MCQSGGFDAVVAYVQVSLHYMFELSCCDNFVCRFLVCCRLFPLFCCCLYAYVLVVVIRF